jgi:hypothetical protein
LPAVAYHCIILIDHFISLPSHFADNYKLCKLGTKCIKYSKNN